MEIKIFVHATDYLPSQNWVTASLGTISRYSQRQLASYVPDEIAKCIFYQEKEVDEYLFQIQFLIKQNQNVGLYHAF